jgi:hypothetical protein
MKDLKLRLKQAKERERERAKQEEAQIAERAAVVKEYLKNDLRQAWVDAGGDLKGFEEAWPGLYQAEMTKRAQDALARASQESRQAIRRAL